MPQLFSNNAVSILAHPINSIDTRLDITPGFGGLYPTISNNSDYFIVTLENREGTLREIVKVIDRIGDTFTIIRGQEGTTPLSWPQITLFDLRDTAGTLKRLQHIVNSPISITFDDDGFCILNTVTEFAPRTTQLWVGGLRQCIEKDYVEVNSNTIKLLFTFDQLDLYNGMNIVLDFYSL